jgi:hypothetical protein
VGLSFDETLIEVWRQVLVDDAKEVILGAEKYTVCTTSNNLREVQFEFAGKYIRGLEERREAKSRRAEGIKIMQFISESRCVASVADGKVTFYGLWK